MTPCILWTGLLHDEGYGYLYISKRKVYAHRHAWEKAFGPIPPGAHVLHKCDNPPCVNTEHLFLGNAKTNYDDARSKGRARFGAIGIRNPRTKLDDDDVRAIRKSRLTERELAAQFGVHRDYICKVRNYIRRKEVPDVAINEHSMVLSGDRRKA